MREIGITTAFTPDAVVTPALAESLTPRQYEIVMFVARGCTNPEIATMLAISVNAVKKHISRVLDVLHVSNRTELAALVGRHALA